MRIGNYRRLPIGLSECRLHRIWAQMKQRCKTTSSTGEYYSWRGITVCEEWQQFLPFYTWAMANGYQEHLTIDRIDVDGNYEPGNCCWATYKQQRSHQRKPTRMVR
jgi:hypothetical protein